MLAWPAGIRAPPTGIRRCYAEPRTGSVPPAGPPAVKAGPSGGLPYRVRPPRSRVHGRPPGADPPGARLAAREGPFPLHLGIHVGPVPRAGRDPYNPRGTRLTRYGSVAARCPCLLASARVPVRVRAFLTLRTVGRVGYICKTSRARRHFVALTGSPPCPALPCPALPSSPLPCPALPSSPLPCPAPPSSPPLLHVYSTSCMYSTPSCTVPSTVQCPPRVHCPPVQYTLLYSVLPTVLPDMTVFCHTHTHTHTRTLRA